MYTKLQKNLKTCLLYTQVVILCKIHSNPKHFNKLAEVDEVVEHLIVLVRRQMDYGQCIQDIHLIHDRWRVLLAWQKLTLNYSNIPMRDLKMLHLKQTLHNLYTTISELSQTQDRFAVLFVPKKKKNLVLVENLGYCYIVRCHEYSLVNGSDPYPKFVVY